MQNPDKKQYAVYIVTNPNKTTLYIGVTNNLPARLFEHWENRGKTDTFAGKYFCHNLIYFEVFQDIKEAIAREKEIKKWRREKKDALIHSKNPEWTFLNAKAARLWTSRKIYRTKNNSLRKSGHIPFIQKIQSDFAKWLFLTSNQPNMKSRIPLIPVAALSLLLIPLIAMQFTNEVKWSGFDFLVMGILLLIAGTAIEWVRRKFKNNSKKWLLIAAVVVVFLLIWAELAVGLFGTPFAGN